MNALNT